MFAPVNTMTNFQKLVGQLKERIYHLSEKERLRSLHTHLDERQKETHSDFLDRHQKHDDHQARVEHHAANFWHYYYPGEPPTAVVQNEPIREHEYWTEEQRRQAQERMIDRRTGKPGESSLAMTAVQRQQHWMFDIMIGDMAMDRHNYSEAEKKYKAALRAAENLGIQDADVLATFRKLASALSAQRKYEEFESIFEKTLKLDMGSIATDGHFSEEETLNQIAAGYLKEGKYDEAKEVYEHALKVLEKLRGPSSAVVARCLNDLAGVYANTDEWQKSENLLKRSLSISENAPVESSADMAATLHNLGALYAHQDKDNEAQELFGRAMVLLEKAGAA